MAIMIPVQLPQEPGDYHHRVREEGLAFLQEQGLNPDQIYSRRIFEMRRIMTDGSGRFRSCEYWQLAREDLKIGYHNRCVYTCFLIEQELVEDATSPDPVEVGGHSIDHFKPVTKNPARLAYEWANLRWAWCYIDNNFKQNQIIPDRHDPVNIVEGAIQLQFDSKGDLIAVPSPLFPDAERLSLADTIKKLGLNDDQVKKFRRDCFDDFINPGNNYSDQYMKEVQPFVYQYMVAS
jgi:hypothetical protein